MENKRGSGIFLGVVSVATLVVTIIGATFAYFSATAEGDNTVDVQSYNFATTLSVSDITGTATATTSNKIIPLEAHSNGTPAGDGTEAVKGTDFAYLLAGVNATDDAAICIDKSGYQACSLYELTFRNDADSAVRLNGTITVTANGFVENHLQLVELADDEAPGRQLSALEKHIVPTSTASVKTIELDEVEVPAKSGETAGTKTIYIAVYLDELGEANKLDMGQTFSGTITYTSTVGGNQLTGKFSL